MAIIQVEHLWYSYGGAASPVLQDLTFRVQAGETLGIIGLNGSGKTTLCYCLCGIIPHYLDGDMRGRVLVNGQNTRETDLHRLATEVGIVLQDPSVQVLMPTVEDDIAFALENNNLPRQEIRKRLYRSMELVGITGLKNGNPNNLSGGEKQLVALATVLALEPAIIVYDEPLAMLDELAAERVIAVMQKLKQQGITQIVIDHTLKGTGLYDKVFVLEAGRIIRRGPPDLVLGDKEFLREHDLLF
ncbi:MAG: ABC transporter ATP-binding protein [Clostridia bacterium]|nr:ABC transporter ATP-binding protein [Clostridia bacterium]